MEDFKEDHGDPQNSLRVGAFLPLWISVESTTEGCDDLRERKFRTFISFFFRGFSLVVLIWTLILNVHY